MSRPTIPACALPVVLDYIDLANAVGVSRRTASDLLRRRAFGPVIAIAGKRVVTKEHFLSSLRRMASEDAVDPDVLNSMTRAEKTALLQRLRKTRGGGQ